MSEQTIESSGNIFADLGLPPEEAELLALKAKLLNELRKLVLAAAWHQDEAARHLSISRARAADLIHSRHEKFSLDMLVTLAVRLGKHCQLHLAA